MTFSNDLECILKVSNYLVLSLTFLGSFHGVAYSQTFNAADPASSGYKLAFGDDFRNAGSIDFAGSGAPGFKWYTTQFFGGKTTPATCLTVKKGVLTLSGQPGDNAGIETAAPATNPDGYVGTVFGGGGYFEASIAFDQSSVNTKNGWPSFWSMAIEHMAEKGKAQWPGQDSGIDRFIEVDFFEDDTSEWAGSNTYGGAVHDTYGKWTPKDGYSMVSNPNFVIRVPKDTDFSKFHRYGCLIVPSKSAFGGIGYIQYFFDGLATSDIVTWVGGKAPALPPPSGDQRFAITDDDHLNVILGCGGGQKMEVQYVHVWQAPQ